MASSMDTTLAEKVLEFFNTVSDPYEIRYRIKDDPNFSPTASGYGITLPVARGILAMRNSLLGGRFASIRQIDNTPGVGPVTLHNILYSFHDYPYKGDKGDPGPQGPPGVCELPRGAILIWSGSLATIPSGWVLCDGRTYTSSNGDNISTPDLRDRFVCGVSAGQNPGVTGGANSHSHAYTDVPVHSHSVIDPGHRHEDNIGVLNSTKNRDGASALQVTLYNDTVETKASKTGIGVKPEGISSSSTLAQVHMPPYYKLAFIMKL